MMKWMLSLLAVFCVAATAAFSEDAAGLLVIDEAPASGLVVTRCDLSWWTRGMEALPLALEAWRLPDETQVPVQLVWDRSSTKANAPCTLVLQVPGAGHWELRIARKDGPPPHPLDNPVVTTTHYALSFAPGQPAGYPSSISFLDTGKQFSTFAWFDRLYDSARGQYMLRNDRAATVELVSDGPLCRVVRVRANYCREDGAVPPSHPFAVYDWYLFNDPPLAFVNAAFHQDIPDEWDELHFLECNFPDASFTQWAGDEPVRTGELTGSAKTEELHDWGMLMDGKTGFAMFGEAIKCYDGRGGYGTYLNSAWRYETETTDARLATWLWLGAADDPVAAAHDAGTACTRLTHAIVTQPELHAKIEAMRERAGEKDADTRWCAALAQRLESLGRLEASAQLADGSFPEGLFVLRANELGMAVYKTGTEVRIFSVFDVATATELAPESPAPLFEATLRKAGSDEEMTVSPQSVWRDVSVTAPSGQTLELSWNRLETPSLDGLGVTLTANADTAKNAIQWTVSVKNSEPEWGVWRVKPVPLTLADLGPGATILTPRGCGNIQKGTWRKPFRFDGEYPSGWCSMQFLAAYRDDPALPATGMSLTALDPFGGFKTLDARTDPATGTLRMGFDIPVENMGVPAREVSLGYPVSWQLLHGDWFDAARAYKAWVNANAKWWPALGKDGRADTPLWMRELCAWAQTSGAPGEVAEPVKAFATFLDVPAGFHWYCWHQTPFDNDYPHYFPERDGMTEAVRDMQSANVYVMPYINGRLWDTRDKGMEDVEFTKVALPAVTKQPDGKPYTESYGSKEQDGSKVVLGVMCPYTRLWQDKQKEIVLKLLTGIGTKGVYMDQIAAASPEACMDAAHGHPLGGGHWWNEGYWTMLDAIRTAKPADSFLTTECNGEPFIHCFDGYLTWHWQYDGQVPVFPAVYGGAIQMFGRSYGGGTTRDVALRMRAAQQLVFGEQIGWLAPQLVNEADNADFFRKTVQMRWRLRRYFYAGEMARPPELLGDMPTVRADWQWGGEMWVTTDAILRGAWRLPEENRLVMIFANVTDVPMAMRFRYEPKRLDLSEAPVNVDSLIGRDGVTETFTLEPGAEREIPFPAREVIAWEMVPVL